MLRREIAEFRKGMCLLFSLLRIAYLPVSFVSA